MLRHKHVGKNEAYREFLSYCGLNGYVNFVSAGRVQMLGSHLPQHLDVKGAMPMFIKTGMSLEYGKTTFSIKMPESGIIERIFHLYPEMQRRGRNPHSVVVYRSQATGKIGMFELATYGSQHQYFGYKFVRGPAYDKLAPGMYVEKGEVFLYPEAVNQETGEYMAGVEVPVAYMSLPAVAEDGIIMSESGLDLFTFRTITKRTVAWGGSTYPLMLYKQRLPNGEEAPAPFPGIGCELRPDGLLMVTRKYDKFHNLIELSKRSLNEINYHSDERVYAPANSRVIDIRVFHNGRHKQSNTPIGMDQFVEMYHDARMKMNIGIYEHYQEYLKGRSGHVRFTPWYTNRIAREVIPTIDRVSVAGKEVGPGRKEAMRYVLRSAPLDAWHVEFTLETVVRPYIGCKLTDLFGGKGVIVAIWPDEDMPTDEDGNRAILVKDADATVNRSNPGRFYYSYMTGASRDVCKRVAIELKNSGYDVERLGNVETLLRMHNEDTGVVDRIWQDILAPFYSMSSDHMRQWLTKTSIDHVKHVASVVEEKIRGFAQPLPLDIFRPPEDEYWVPEVIDNIERNFPQTFGPVTFRAPNRKMVKSIENVRISHQHIIFLEKTAEDWAAADSGKVQIYGVLSKLTNRDKYANPVRLQTTRITGEAEIRALLANVGYYATADLFDRSNNPDVHFQICTELMINPHPTAIRHLVDRKKYPLGNNRPAQFINHVAETAGFKFVYKPCDYRFMENADSPEPEFN